MNEEFGSIPGIDKGTIGSFPENDQDVLGSLPENNEDALGSAPESYKTDVYVQYVQAEGYSKIIDQWLVHFTYTYSSHRLS